MIMESKWQKMNSVLYQKIQQYDRSTQNPYELQQFEKEKKKIFEQIEQRVKKHKTIYSFPRKNHESQKMCEKEDAALNEQLSGKTYNLNSQNAHSTIIGSARSSSFHISKPSSKNQFEVRKNNRHKLSQNLKKNISSQQQQSDFTEVLTGMMNVTSHQNLRESSSCKDRIINIRNSRLKKVPDRSKFFKSPQSTKNESKLYRQYSTGSLKSNKQNKLPMLNKGSRIDLKASTKSRFNEIRHCSKIKTEPANEQLKQ